MIKSIYLSIVMLSSFYFSYTIRLFDQRWGREATSQQSFKRTGLKLMQMINYYMVLLVIFSMIALGEVFKLKKEVRKLNKVTDFLLKQSQEEKPNQNH